MDQQSLNERLDGFAEAAVRLITWHQKGDDKLSSKQIARIQELSAGVQSILRALNQYEDAVEIAPILKDMEQPFSLQYHDAQGTSSRDGATQGIMYHDVPGQMYVLELFARRILNAAEAQLPRIEGKPPFSLEHGIETLRRLAPATSPEENSITKRIKTLQHTLGQIAEGLSDYHVHAPQLHQERIATATPIAAERLSGVTLRLLAQLSQYADSMDYETIAALPLLCDNARLLKEKIETEEHLSPDTTQDLVNLLHVISSELPETHANTSIKRDVNAMAMAQYRLAGA